MIAAVLAAVIGWLSAGVCVAVVEHRSAGRVDPIADALLSAALVLGGPLAAAIYCATRSKSA